MNTPYPFIFAQFLRLIILLPVFVSGIQSKAQLKTSPNTDTIPKHSKVSGNIKDSLQSLADTIYKSSKAVIQLKRDELKSQFKKLSELQKNKPTLHNPFKKDTGRIQFDNPFKNLLNPKPAFRVSDGYVAYQFYYRSNIDTPFVEKNIGQHNVTGRLNFFVAGNIPLLLNYWVRRSNSNLFKDITDVQLSFNAYEFANRLQSAIRNKLLGLAGQLKDSLAEQLYNLKLNRLQELYKWLNKPLSLQNLVEANEILNVPRITYDPVLPVDVNERRADSLKKLAAIFMDLYKKTRTEYEYVNGQVDSLKKIYEQSLTKIRRFRQMINGEWQSISSLRDWKSKLGEFGFSNIEIPAKYRWLMGLRNFSLGRSPINYSELTAKNISINGVSFEYNSWYYLAFTAGVVDYRFRDFVVSPLKKTPQWLYLLRAGIGRVEGNHFIVSVYRGQKQLFTGSSNRAGLSSITISGISLETRWRIQKTSWLSAEVSKSIAPDFRNNPPAETTKLNLSDRTNQAMAVKLFSWLPKTGSRIEAMYKYTGANFQSFSSFQTNAGQEAWYIKGEQNLFKRQLRFHASVRSNDYFNPFIVQQYKSNTVFKSIMATFRRRKWPVVSLGYQPMSQLTKLDNQLLESRFQALTASLYYLYQLDRRRAATTFVYNQFYNSNSDSGFIYYNAINLYAVQNFFFRFFNAGIGVSYTQNSSYEMIVMDENVQWNFQRLGSIGFGVKINNYNSGITKLGGYLSANIRISRQDILTLNVERGYLPGYFKGLVRNDMGNIQFTRSFSFR